MSPSRDIGRDDARREPWSKWYWGDHAGNQQLNLCSFAARGLWMALQCVMAESPRKGFLLLPDGTPPDERTIFRLTHGASLVEQRRCLAELEQNHVSSVDASGVLFSRRMVRDVARQLRNRENGGKGGNPRLSDAAPSRITDLDKPDSRRAAPPSDKPQMPEARSQKDQKPDRGDPAPTRHLLEQFDAAHQRRFGTKADLKPGKDAKHLADLWRARRHDPLTAETLIAEFFASNDPFIVQAGFTVGVFVSQVGKLLARHPATTAAPSGSRIPDDVRQLCEKAGITNHNIEQWFKHAELKNNTADGVARLVVPDQDVRGFIARNYHAALEAAAIGASIAQLVIEVA